MKITVIWNDGEETVYEEGVDKVVKVYEEDPRNMKGCACFTITYENGVTCRFMNTTYIVEEKPFNNKGE